jgi:hypothetical protein
MYAGLKLSDITKNFMWQHAANIVIGLLLITASFITTGTGLMNPELLWWFAGAGILIVIFGCWGLYDELSYESHAGDSTLEYK